MLYLIALAAGVVLGLVTRGKFSNLALLKFRWPWLIVAAVVVRYAVLLPPLDRFEASRYLYVLALAGIVAWTLWQVDRVAGIWIVSIGAALNLLVIAVNSFRMPVAPEFASHLAAAGSFAQYTVMSSETTLNLLGDWIKLSPSPEVYSVGDVLVSIGLAIVVFLSIRKPRLYRAA